MLMVLLSDWGCCGNRQLKQMFGSEEWAFDQKLVCRNASHQKIPFAVNEKGVWPVYSMSWEEYARCSKRSSRSAVRCVSYSDDDRERPAEDYFRTGVLRDLVL
jgi:hypothetical protein